MYLRWLSLWLVACGLAGCASDPGCDFRSGWLVREDGEGKLVRWQLCVDGKNVFVGAPESDAGIYGKRKGHEIVLVETKNDSDGVRIHTNAVWTCAWLDSGRLKAQRQAVQSGVSEESLFQVATKDRRLITKTELEMVFSRRFPWAHFTHRYEMETRLPEVEVFGPFLGRYFKRLHEEHIRESMAQNIERTWFDWAGNDPYWTWTDDYELMEWRSAQFMSLLVASFQHVQGAGGFGQKTGLNLWVHDGEVREVRLAELFRDGSPYVAVLGRYCWNELKKRKVAELGVRFPKGIGSDDLGVFVIQRQGVMMVFQDVGMEERVMVPWAELAECIEPDGVVNMVRFGRK